MTAERFDGFGPDALAFLRDLAANQDRAWFEANKSRYEREVLRKLNALIVAVSAELRQRDVPLMADTRKAVFRIHRDVRFSRDKAPYKTNAGAVLSRDGSKDSPGLLYIHIDPVGCFVASGFYQPAPPALGALREAILTEPRRFVTVEAALHGAGLEIGRDSALTRMPRGFEQAADSDMAWALRLKSFIVRRAVLPEAISRANWPAEIAEFALAALPLLRFGWDAIALAEAGR